MDTQRAKCLERRGRGTSWFRLNGTEAIKVEIVGWPQRQQDIQCKNMTVLYELMVDILELRPPAGRECFEVQAKERHGRHCCCISLTICYCCGIPERNYFSCVKHGLSVRRPHG